MTRPDHTLCPDCGAHILRDSPRGLCVGCLTRDLFFAEDLPEPEEEGTMISTWRVLRQAGEGAFGLVYEAQQEKPVRRKAALKMLKPGLDSREILTRFATEREALAVLDHAAIARVLDAGTETGRPWIAAEWVEEARAITEYCQEKQLSIADRVRLFQQVCEAVAHAHQRGIIHRDLKPSNILVSGEGQPKVIDFGIARATEQVLAKSTLVTLAGQVLGTPAYMSPEQAAGRSGEVDTRSDLYSLGAVLHEMLTGQPLFPRQKLESSSIQEALRIVREESPAKPSTHNPALKGELEWILLKALEKDPARRYETAAALARDLGHWLNGGTVLAAPPSRSYQLRTFLRRHRTAALGVASVFVALIAGLAGTTGMFFRARTGEEAALKSSQRALAEEAAAKASSLRAEAGEAAARANSARAEAGEAAARRNASLGDHQTAQVFFDKNQPVTAVMHLARAVRTDPTNAAAAERLMGELAYTDFPRPAWPAIECTEFIRGAAFSPDGSRLAVRCSEPNPGYAPGQILLLDTATGQPVTHPIPHGVHWFAFSPDSKIIALSFADGKVRFRKASDGAPGIWPSLPRQRSVWGLSWGGMQRLSTLENEDMKSTGRLWDMSDPGQPKVLFEIPLVAATSFPAWSPDHARIAWIQADGTVTVVNAADGKTISSWRTGGLGMLAFQDKDTVAVQTIFGSLQLYKAASGKPVGQPARSSASPFVVVPSPDGTSLLTCGWDGVSTLWNAENLTPLCELPGRWQTGSFADHGGLLALRGDLENEVLLFDMNRLRPARPPIPVPGKPAMVALSADGRLLACGGRQRRLTVYDLQPRAARPELHHLQAEPWTGGWTPDGTSIYYLDLHGGAHQRAPATAALADADLNRALQAAAQIPGPGSSMFGQFRKGLPPGGWFHLGHAIPTAMRPGLPPEEIRAAALSPTGRWLTFSDIRSGLYHFSLPDGARLAAPELGSGVVALEYSADSSKFLASLEDGSLVLLVSDTLSIVDIWRPRQGPALALAFLPDGRVLSGGEDGTVAISPGGPAIPCPPDLPGSAPAAVRSLAVTPDATRFVTGNTGGMACIWETATLRPLTPPLRHLSGADSVSGVILLISPDGRLLATGGCHDGAARLWDISSGESRGVLKTDGMVTNFTFDATGRRLLTLGHISQHGTLHCWDTASALPLMPPQPLLDSKPGLFLTLHPSGTRVMVGSAGNLLSIFDLPPVFSTAPAHLAETAESWTGWRFGPTGLPEITASGMKGAETPTAPAQEPADAWISWLQSPSATRSVSPLSHKTMAEHLETLKRNNSLEAWVAYNELHPAPGFIAAFRACDPELLKTEVGRQRAEKLAWQALEANTTDESTVGLVASVLCAASDQPAAGRLLLQRIQQQPENPDTWDNAAWWLEQMQALIPATACRLRSAALESRRGEVRREEYQLELARKHATKADSIPGTLLPSTTFPPPPADHAAALALLFPAPADPVQHYREACTKVNADPKNGASWWSAAEAAAAMALLTGTEKDKSSAWIGFMACGARLEYTQLRIGDDTWTPSVSGSLSAILHSPVNLQGMIALANSYHRQLLASGFFKSPASLLELLELPATRQ